MVTTTFDFETQLKQGFEGEAELVAHLTAQGWHCIKATIAQEKTGIDYICKHKKTGVTRTIEIKSDSRASHTQNAFIETVSVKKGKNIIKQGWAYTCQANYLFYYLPQDLIAYAFKVSHLRLHLDEWLRKNYRLVSVPNRGYVTQGILVPLWELEKNATQIINI